MTSSCTLYGGALSHLSYSMSHFGIPGSVVMRVFSVVLRIGGDAASYVLTSRPGHIAPGVPCLLFRACMVADITWMATMICLSLAQAYALSHMHRVPATPVALASDNEAVNGEVLQRLDYELSEWLRRKQEVHPMQGAPPPARARPRLRLRRHPHLPRLPRHQKGPPSMAEEPELPHANGKEATAAIGLRARGPAGRSFKFDKMGLAQVCASIC